MAGAARAQNLRPVEIRLGLVAWAVFIALTCAYCLLHQTFVSAVTPDVGRTITVALREWGAWALLAPCALSVFRRPLPWREALVFAVPLALLAASLPIVVDQLTDERGLGASLALFWPRNFAMAVALLCIARLSSRAVPAQPAMPEVGKPEAPRTLLVSKGADQCLIRVDDIQHLSAAGNYVDICATDQRYLMRATMGEVEAMLPPEHFVRIHRSHIVRVREIERICVARSGSGTVHLRGGGRLAISKSYRAQLKAHQETLKPPVH